MGHRWGLVFSVLLLVALSSMAWAQEREFRPSPSFTGDRLPAPPQQGAAWEPPAGMPDALVSATRALCAAGFADPRGCEYREIAVGTGSCWSGDAGVVKTHGWMLPAVPDEKQRFAVCWNGLVYPVVFMGEKADLPADVQELLKADEAQREKWKKEYPDNPFDRYEHATPESMAISPLSLLPVKSCLLLRLGEGDRARRVWEAWNIGANLENSAYAKLAGDWLWYRFDRAVTAHMRGDDKLALLDARALASLRVTVTTEVKGQNHPNAENRLQFLAPVPVLLADQERRAKKPATAPVSVQTILAIPERSQRIAALIDALDDMQACQDGQPGGVYLGGGPVADALVNEGGAAVEPLLTVVETDTRLTRSVSFHRDFFPNRNLLEVARAAYAILCRILQTSDFGPFPSGSDDQPLSEMEKRRLVVRKMRAYWQQNRGRSPEERWYRRLADDAATPSQWQEAAEAIIRPVDVNSEGGWISIPARKPGEMPRLSGEALRKKTTPSVTQLMAKRVTQLAARTFDSTDEFQAQSAASQMALCLAEWDMPAALPVLRVQIQHNRNLLTRQKGGSVHSGYAGNVTVLVTRMTLARARGKDPQALVDYAAWVRGITPRQADTNCDRVLAPLWRYPHHPAIAAAAEWLFNDPHSPWIPLVQQGYSWGSEQLFTSPLLGVGAFRKQLLTGLANPVKAGVIKVAPGGRMDITLDAGWSTGVGQAQDDPLGPKPGSQLAVRLCDVYAMYLSTRGVECFPAFQPCWPLAERDKAIAAIVQVLRRYGERFAADANQLSGYYDDGYARVEMQFPRLGHPATEGDVTSGRAIFSLQGHPRLYPMPSFPLKAKWTTFKTNPYQSTNYDEVTGKSETQLIYRQDGLVWQAEEVEKDGVWQRYFGFIGQHQIARAPAAEIEFPAWDFGQLSSGLDLKVQLSEAGHYPLRFLPGTPIPLTLLLRNRRGVDMNVPAVFASQIAAGIQLYKPLQPHLFFTTDPPPTRDGQSQHWTEIPQLPVPAQELSEERTTLAPAAERPILACTLQQLFAATKAGHYRCYFSVSGPLLGEGKTPDIYFDLLEKP